MTRQKTFKKQTILPSEMMQKAIGNNSTIIDIMKKDGCIDKNNQPGIQHLTPTEKQQILIGFYNHTEHVDFFTEFIAIQKSKYCEFIDLINAIHDNPNIYIYWDNRFFSVLRLKRRAILIN